jgi:Glycosyltransferase
MKILILHNEYQQRGGEDAVVAAEEALLFERGHEVRVAQAHNNDISGFVSKATVFATVAYSRGRYLWAKELLAGFRPDILHIHNFFPLLTPAVHHAATDMGVPVVQTLHNFRLTCANALLLRDGHVCEKCVGGSKLWGAYHRCYRASLPASLAVVHMQLRAQRSQTWKRHVHRFIALTEFARGKFIAAGLPGDRISVKPNFVSAAHRDVAKMRAGALFVGRLSPEKGVTPLIDAWHSLPDIPLTVIGDGPERPRLAATAPPNVRFLGQMNASAVREEMARAEFLVMPSIWYEGFPMTVVEAFSQGLPVLASRIGALEEIVLPDVNGGHFEPSNPMSIVGAVNAFRANAGAGSRLEAGARRTYQDCYTGERNAVQLEKIYAEAIEQIGQDRAANWV